VIQRRIQPVPELFPAEGQDPQPWIISWGAFTISSGFGGVYTRGVTVESNVEVIQMGGGAYSGSCLYASQDDD